MKKIFLLSSILLSSLMVDAQSYIWTGAVDTDFENPGNWIGTPTATNTPPLGYPSFGETAIFDGSVSQVSCVFPFTEDFTTLNMLSNYTGTVDASGNDFNITTINVQGGTFICPNSTLTIIGNLIKSATSTFISNPNSWINWDLNSTGLRTISGAFNLQNIVIASSGGAGNRSINFGAAGTASCVNLFLSGGTNPMAYRGLINITSSLTISGTATTGAPTNTGTFVLTGAGAKSIIGTSTASQNPICNIKMNHTGALSMSGNICSTGTWNFTNVGSYTSGASIVTANGGTVSSGTTAATRGYFDNLTIGGAGLTINGTSQIELKGNLTNNSSITSNNSLLIFNGAAAQSITGTNAATLNAIQISNNVGALGIALSILDSVKISGGALTTGGLLTLRSSSAKKARIAEISGGVLLGNITVETFAPGGTTDWVNIGVSGVSGKTLANWDGQIPMTCNGCTNGTTSASGPFASAVSWNEAAPANDPNAYVTMSNTDPLTPGKGFWIYLGTGLSTTTDMLWTVSGAPVTGNVSIPLTNSGAANGDGYNLIANPYPSPISWTKLLGATPSVSNAIYIYNPDLGVTTDFVGGVSSHVNGANDVIPMGQAFYVKAQANISLTAQESNKVSHNTAANPLLKSATSSSTIGDVIRLNVAGGGYTDRAAIRFHANATNNFDGALDSEKMYSSPGYVGYPGAWTKRTVISTQMNNIDYSTNSLPHPTTQSAVIPVIVRVYSTGQYTISGSDLENLPPTACIILFDKLTNIQHDLRSGDYVCNISDTTFAARFELTVCAASNAPTTVKTETKPLNNSIYISKDSKGVFANLNFDKATNATISVTNILGQKIIDNKKVNVTKETVYLDINTADQLIFVTVETENEKVTKKFLNFN